MKIKILILSMLLAGLFCTVTYFEHTKQNVDQRKYKCATFFDDWTHVQEEISFDHSTARISDISQEVIIPVVVHVVYKTEEENISDYQITSQIEVLNEDFSGTNKDIVNVPTQFKSVLAGDTKIRFKLATVDPSGKPTSGIYRHKTNIYSFDTGDNGVKYTSTGGVDAWDTGSYLNIWVCRLQGLAGYAQFPKGDKTTDGVVIDYRYIGKRSVKNAAIGNLGRTATHEVGHWLGLRHVWGDGGCDSDDGISDTPVADTQGEGCITVTECGSLNMNTNFMDYGNDACLNSFTKGQANKMQSMFYKGGARESFKVSPAAPLEAPATTQKGSVKPPILIKQNKDAWVVSWGRIPNIDFYSLKVRLSDHKWKYYDIPKEATSAALNNLDACTNYQVQIIGVEGVKTLKGRSTIEDLQTARCNSKIPRNFKVSSKEGRTVSLVWTPTKADKYEVQWRVYGTSKVFTKITSKSISSLTKLKKGKVYQVRVRSVLKGSETSPFSKVVAFKL